MAQRVFVVMCRPVRGGRPQPVRIGAESVASALAQARQRGLDPVGDVTEIHGVAPPPQPTPSAAQPPAHDPRPTDRGAPLDRSEAALVERMRAHAATQAALQQERAKRSATLADACGALLALAALAPLVYLAESGFPGSRSSVYTGAAIMAAGTLIILAAPRTPWYVTLAPILAGFGFLLVLAMKLQERLPVIPEEELRMHRPEFQREIRATGQAFKGAVETYFWIPAATATLQVIALRISKRPGAPGRRRDNRPAPAGS